MRSAVALVACLIAGNYRPADACSQPECWAGAFVPGEGATVPANLPAIYWSPIRGGEAGTPDPTNVTLATAAQPTVALPFTATPSGAGYLLVPDEPLQPNTAYVVTDHSTCGGTGRDATFQTGPAAPLPAQLGTLVQRDEGFQSVMLASSGLCTSAATAHMVEIEIRLAAEAEPWRDVLFFETWVDGESWLGRNTVNDFFEPGASWRGRGIDAVYHVCTSEHDVVEPGLAAGSHAVEMRASIAGTSTALASPSITVAMFACPEGPAATCETEPRLCENVDSGGGCGCATGASPSWFAGWLALLVARRRHLNQKRKPTLPSIPK